MPRQASRVPAAKGQRARRRNKKSGKNSSGGLKPSSSGALVGGLSTAGASMSRMSDSFMPLFPPRTYKTLRYHTSVSLSVTTGALSTYVFRANDLFDPDFTSTGHQPMGFDQMMVFYNHFAVATSRIKAQFTNTAPSPFHVGVRLDASSTAITNPDQLIEYGGVTYDVVEAKNIYGSSKSMELSVDIARIQGMPRRNITTDSMLRGDAATSPTEVTYFHVFCWDPAFSNTGSVSIDVTIDYSAYFFEPRDATESLARLRAVPAAAGDSKPSCLSSECKCFVVVDKSKRM